MIVYDWIWIAVIAATTCGAVVYSWVAAKSEVAAELNALREDIAHEKKRKKYWKALAKGKSVKKSSASGGMDSKESPKTISIQGRMQAGTI